MRDDVVRRAQALAVPGVRDERDRSVVLVADDAPCQVLARQLAAVEVERVAVAVVRRKSIQRHVAVVIDPTPLTIVRNVAEDEISADAVPRRTFEPQPSGPETLNRRVRLDEAVERRIDGQDVRVVEVQVRRRVRAEVARRHRDGRRGARLLRERRRRGRQDTGRRTDLHHRVAPRYLLACSFSPAVSPSDPPDSERILVDDCRSPFLVPRSLDRTSERERGERGTGNRERRT